ncbi:MAG: tetratricopeptide repeat protein [Limisphaerales bacterium]
MRNLAGVSPQGADGVMKLSPGLILALLLTVELCVATSLQPRALAWTQGRASDQLMQVLLGDGRQILANQMFVEADVYFHSGYYPSMFDQAYAPTNAQHMTRDAGPQAGHEPDVDTHAHDHHEEEEHEKAMSFLGPPRNWLERFGRKFAITSHTHLGHGKEREILPWLRLSASLDPHRIETYVVAAYWLRQDLGKTKEAEDFLREGLKANPSSYELLLELGRLYYENYHDAVGARNVWNAALRRWTEQEGGKPEPDLGGLAQITVRLARLEEKEGHYAKAIELLELTLAHKASPHPEVLREQVQALRLELGRQRIPH